MKNTALIQSLRIKDQHQTIILKQNLMSFFIVRSNKQNIYFHLKLLNILFYFNQPLIACIFCENQFRNFLYGQYFLFKDPMYFVTILFIIFYFKLLKMYGHQQAPSRYPSHPQQPPPYNGYPPHSMQNQQYPPQNYHQGVPPAQGQPYHPHFQGQRNSHPNANYQYPAKPPGLMQPPALNAEEPMDTNSQFFAQRPPMTVSNNQHSQFDAYQQQQQDGMWAQEAQIASMYWQQRCMTMLERFQWFYDRFEILRNDHNSLSEEMGRMDSEEEWHQFQQHHEQFHEKIDEMEQQLKAVLNENQQLLLQRRIQDSQNVWQQRYQQLLGNFKSLQEEYAEKEAAWGRGGISDEQYRQLQEHCAELEYQYEQTFNELKMYKEGGLSSQAENQIGAYIQQIQSYKGKLNNLHGENVEMQKMLEQFESQNEQLKAQRYKMGVDRSKFQQLMHLVEQKQQQIISLQQQFKSKSSPQVSVGNLEAIIQERSRENQELRRQINEKNSQINRSNSKLSELQNSTRLKANQQLQQTRRTQQKRINDLQKQISDLKSQKQKLLDQIHKSQSLQRKLNQAKDQINLLNDTLKKKNQELIDLRSLTYQIQKLKQAQEQMAQAAEEREHLSQSLRKKTLEIEKLHTQLERITAIVNQATSKRQEYSVRNLRSQIDDLTDQLRFTQGEVHKLKSILALKDDYSSQLEEELKLNRQKLVMLQQLLEAERQGFRQKQIKLSAKGNDYNERIRALDYEFNLQLKDNLEREVSNLRKQSAQRQQKIRSLQQKQLVLLSQIAVYQKQDSNFNRDIQLQKQKEKQLLVTIEAHVKRYSDLEATLRAKEQQINSIQQSYKQANHHIAQLNGHIQQNEALVKSKNKTISDFKQQLSQSLQRLEKIDQLIAQNTKLRMRSQAFERQFQKQESPLSKSKALSAVNSKKNLQSQQNVISQLWKQNEFLKQEIAKLLSKYSEGATHFTASHSSVDLNRRLNEFNQRLHIAISSSANNPTSQLTRTESQKSVILWQQQRNQLVQHYEYEIQSLKKQLENIRISGSQISRNDGLTQSKKGFYGNLQNERIREQISFLQQKIQQAEDRNKHLIEVNGQLRAKIDSVLLTKQNQTALDYYKSQLQRVQSEKESLKQRLKHLSEENRENKLQLASKNTKLTQEQQFKIMQLQIVLQQQLRKISILQGEKASADNQKATLEHSLKVKTLNTNKSKNIEPAEPSPKSVHSGKQGLQQQFGSVLGNLSGYGYYENSPKASINVASNSNVRVQGSKYSYRNEQRY